MEQDTFVVEGEVEVDPATMAVFVGGEGLAVMLLERFGVTQTGRFYGLDRLRVTVEHAD